MSGLNRVEGRSSGGWGGGGGTMAKIITFHVDAKGFYIHSYMSCINSKWLNRVEGRSSVGWGWGGTMAKTMTFHVDAKGFCIHSSKN